MSSQGNNTSITNAEVRDAFLDTNVGFYFKRRIAIADDVPIEGISCLSSVQVVKTKDKIQKKIDKLENPNLQIGLSWLMNISTKEGTYNKIDANVMRKVNPTLKRVYAEMLIECVEEGMYDEDEMQYVEDELAFLLYTIEDLHPVMEREI